MRANKYKSKKELIERVTYLEERLDNIRKVDKGQIRISVDGSELSLPLPTMKVLKIQNNFTVSGTIGIDKDKNTFVEDIGIWRKHVKSFATHESFPQYIKRIFRWNK